MLKTQFAFLTFYKPLFIRLSGQKGVLCKLFQKIERQGQKEPFTLIIISSKLKNIFPNLSISYFY